MRDNYSGFGQDEILRSYHSEGCDDVSEYQDAGQF
jgi:hypothetical protein